MLNLVALVSKQSKDDSRTEKVLTAASNQVVAKSGFADMWGG
jgi:hypothetical protein